VKGQSGNPNGRPSTKKALEACGTTGAQLTAEAWQVLIDAMRSLNPGDKDESASWRFAVQQILDRLQGKPKEAANVEDSEDADVVPDDALDLTDLSDEELQVLMKIGVRVDPRGN
jgi:hypothetical protein